jgi:hypothetical protein
MFLVRTDRLTRCSSSFRSLFSQGTLARTVGATLMNHTSSRSHAIFTVTVDRKSDEGGGRVKYSSAKLHLVDLAGAERQKRTGATGKRFKERYSDGSSVVVVARRII